MTAKARSLNSHVRLEQRVRADEDVDVAGRQPLEQLGARAALLAAREQRQAQAGRRRRAARWCRHAGAPAPRSAPSARPARRPRPRSPWPSAPPPSCRSRRRPAAGAACGAARAMSSAISFKRLALRVGEREGQRVGDAGADACRRRRRCGRGWDLRLCAHQGQRQLSGQQLVVGKALPGRRGRRHVGGLVGPVQRAERRLRHRASRAASSQAASCHSGSSGTRSSACRAALSSTLPERPGGERIDRLEQGQIGAAPPARRCNRDASSASCRCSARRGPRR